MCCYVFCDRKQGFIYIHDAHILQVDLDGMIWRMTKFLNAESFEVMKAFYDFASLTFSVTSIQDLV